MECTVFLQGSLLIYGLSERRNNHVVQRQCILKQESCSLPFICHRFTEVLQITMYTVSPKILSGMLIMWHAFQSFYY